MQPTLRLLGRFDLTTDSGAALNIPGARAQLLLARLALARGERLDRATLSTMFWGERADAQARASLRQLIWSIRQAMKPYSAALVAEGETLALDPSVIASDVQAFERLAASPDPHDLEAALKLYRGDLLDGIDLITLAPDGFILQERERLRDLALKVARSLAGTSLRARNWDDVIRASRRGLAIDPFDEVLQAHLVQALQGQGRIGEARHQDESFRQRLKSELGVTAPARVLQTSRGAFPDRLAATAAPLVTPDPTADPGRTWVKRNLWPMAGGAALVAGIVLAVTFENWRPLTGSPARSAAPTVAVARIPTPNLEAYDRFLRAETARPVMTEDLDLPGVMAAYRQAFELDPDFADAYAGYAKAAVEIWERSLDEVTPSVDARKAAYVAAGRALEIDPGNARALMVLSRIQAQDGAVNDAVATARRAVALEPSRAEAHGNLAMMLSYAGNATAARGELEILRRLDPAPRPEWLLIYGDVAFSDGRYDDAIADFAAVWPMLPKNRLMLQHFAAALALQGRFRQAGQVKDRLLDVMPRANLHLVAQRYSGLLGQKQKDNLLKGLQRAGLPDWPYGFSAPGGHRLTGPDLAAVATDANWSGHLGGGGAFTQQSDAAGRFAYQGESGPMTGRQFLRGDDLCQTSGDSPAAREACGPVYLAGSGEAPDSAYVFVTADEVRYFSVTD